jgi:amino acid transporter
VVPIWLLGGSSLVLAVVVAVTNSFGVMVSVGAALEAFIYAAAGLVLVRLRRREPDRERPFRMRGGNWLPIALTVLFGLFALIASVSVGPRISPIPLVIMVVFAGLVTAYAYTYLPRLEQRAEAEAAARRAARTATRKRRAAPKSK